MNEKFSIVPPPKLVKQWIGEIWHEGTPVQMAQSDLHLAARAAEWGVNQFKNNLYSSSNYRNQLGLKEQALKLLDKAEDPSWDINDFSIVRKALE